jgi:hypothetical protein
MRWHPDNIAIMEKPFEKLSKAPVWQGQSLFGKTIVVQMEMGYGDCIQWFRYLPLLKAWGARRLIVLQTKSLHNLLVKMECIDHITNNEDTPEVQNADYWIGSMSLTYFAMNGPKYIRTMFPTTPDYVFGRDGYLDEKPIPLDGKVKIGLNWGPSRKFMYDIKRCEISDLLEITQEFPDFTFYSLNPEDDGPFKPLPTTDWKENWAVTAGYIQSMDLVITVDTGTAHMAGALGKECLVMLPEDKYVCWRWKSKGWYSSIKTFSKPSTKNIIEYLNGRFF